MRKIGCKLNYEPRLRINPALFGIAFRAKGRKLIFRSDPFKKKELDKNKEEERNKDQNDRDLEYFFSW